MRTLNLAENRILKEEQQIRAVGYPQPLIFR